MACMLVAHLAVGSGASRADPLVVPRDVVRVTGMASLLAFLMVAQMGAEWDATLVGPSAFQLVGWRVG